MVVFDTSVLLLVLSVGAKPPYDPKTKAPVEQAAERVDFLVQRLNKEKIQIIIPTPVLSEVLVHANEATDDYLNIMIGKATFRIAPFDQMAAIEVAFMMREAVKSGRMRDSDKTRAQVKFDWQIVAIAKVQGVDRIYSDDKDIHRYAARAGLRAVHTRDLDLPPEAVEPRFL